MRYQLFKFAIMLFAMTGGITMEPYRFIGVNNGNGWVNSPSTATPVSAENLNIDEDGIKYNNSHLRTSSLYSQAIEEMSASISDDLLAQFNNAIATGSVKIAFVGDSITEGYDQTNLNDVYVERFIRDLKSKFPSVTIEYTNFALTGRTLGLFVASAYKDYSLVGDDWCQTRPWLTDTNKVWREYVKDYAPDLVVVAFGENDSVSTKANGEKIDKTFADNLDILTAYINTWTKKPSVAIVTPLLRTTDETVLQSVYGYIPSKEVSQALARATRYYAKDKGYVLCDANRLWKILRDGVDDVKRASLWERNFYEYATAKWTGDKSSFTLSGTTLTPNGTNKFIARDIDYYEGTIDMYITPTAYGDNGVMYLTVRDDSDLGAILFDIKPSSAADVADALVYIFVRDKAGAYTQLAVSSGFVLNANSSYHVKIESTGSHHTCYIAGTKRVSVDYYGIMHDGKITIGSPNSCPIISGFILSNEVELKDAPMYEESDLLGTAPYDDKTTSGDGLHHPSGLGHAVAYEASMIGIIDKAEKSEIKYDWKAAVNESGVTGTLKSKRDGDNVCLLGNLTFTTPITANSVKMCQIQSEYAPDPNLLTPVKICMISDSSGTIGYAPVYVDSDGYVYVHGEARLTAANVKTVYVSLPYTK